jgi:hypothetical protein
VTVTGVSDVNGCGHTVSIIFFLDVLARTLTDFDVTLRASHLTFKSVLVYLYQSEKHEHSQGVC